MTAIAHKPSPGTAPGGSVFRRPTAETGWKSWFTTVDHKKIGIMYYLTALFFFLVGGIEALLIRTQLATPGAEVLTADQYDQVFTMHGLTMIFFAVIPLGTAFFNYLLPLQIGARDVAFPRLNALSYWVFLFAGLFVYSSMLFGGMPDGGWFGYAPLSIIGSDPSGYTLFGTETTRMAFYSLGLQIAGIASLASSVNFIVTILNMRAPGMTLMRMPIFTWMIFVTSFLMLFAMPIIGVALWMLMFDVAFGASFFRPSAGGDPLMWQHLFWLFGHPEVYIIIMPAFGIVSEVIPAFARKPLFGYAAMVFASIAIGFMGFGVWAHHMFTVGLGPVATSAFALSTMFIAVPTGVKIFNWMGTLWGGQLRLTTSMLFAIGMVAMFTIGGLSGVTHGLVPHNAQQHDTYYVVAHFHYVMFGGSVFGLFAGSYYWYPKVTGRLLKENLGKLHFWLIFIGFNLTFGPMHIVGLAGMPRRQYTYPDDMGWNLWNMMESIGSLIVAIGVLVFLINIVVSRRGPQDAGHDPWDARTLEWLTTSPPAPFNWTVVPKVSSRDEAWTRKYGHDEGQPQRVPADASPEARAEELARVGYDPGGSGEGIHMPSPSYWPLVLAAGLPIMAYGVIFTGVLRIVLIAVGFLVLLTGMFGWALEPTADDSHDDHEMTAAGAH